MARQSGPASLQVRRFMPPLTLLQLERLPSDLRKRHQTFMENTQTITGESQQRRARHLALTLLFLGENQAAINQQLQDWRFDPAACVDAAQWALKRKQAQATKDRRSASNPPLKAGRTPRRT